MSMTADETLLDRLEEIRVKRVREISEDGEDFILENSQIGYRGILASDRKSIKFHATALVLTGHTYQGKGGRFFILSVADKAGCRIAEVAPVIGSAKIFRKETMKGGNVDATPKNHLVPDAVDVPVFERRGDEITMPRYAAGYVGKVVTVGGSLYEVAKSRISGPTAILQVREYRPDQPKGVVTISRPFTWWNH